jgi:hypothetical protein
MTTPLQDASQSLYEIQRELQLYKLQRLEEVRQMTQTLMFEPLTDEDEILATMTNRIGKGFANDFLLQLTEHWSEYNKKNPEGHYVVPLNEREGAAFFGKATDSLYTTLHAALKRNECDKEWRLVRIKKDDKTFLRIVKV